jgi:hypothetical protein
MRRAAVVIMAFALPLACGTSKPSGTGTGAAGTGAAGATIDAGGDTGVVATSPFTDGTRLVARWYAFAGTTPLFAGITDLQEKTPCRFARASDGQLRCLPETLAPPADPPERWAAGTEQVGDDPTTRVRSHWITSADGGRFPNRFTGELYDAKAARACAPAARPGSEGLLTVCMPPSAWATGYDFADDRCKEPLAIKLTEAEMPALIVLADGTFHEVGAPFMGQLYSNQAPGGCGPSLPSAPFYVRAGALLPSDAVPAIEIAPRGTGRLALRMLEAEGVALGSVSFSDAFSPSTARPGPYVDSTLGLDCQPVWTADGEPRCLPSAATYVSGPSLQNFADPGCTQPVSNSRGLLVVLGPRDASGRSPALEVRRLDADVAPEAYRLYEDGICRSYPKGAGRRILDAVPLSTYALLEASLPP